METKTAIGLSISGTIISYLWGKWSELHNVLLIMIALDVITGFIKALVLKDVKSQAMYRGMIRKGMILLVLIVAHQVDVVMNYPFPFVSTAALYYNIGMEGLSVLENLNELQVPLPPFIRNYLEALKDRGESPEKQVKP